MVSSQSDSSGVCTLNFMDAGRCEEAFSVAGAVADFLSAQPANPTSEKDAKVIKNTLDN
ncbi:hypothetical protein [Pediococcus pentosaceus]|uniref:hypothetical protein n=1 Tax=Pediococcus pentosaceus TaxID=1255 RepID=UPI001E50362D|nr:hypothetical protein [Pediococcus pentosaceus]